MSQILISNKEYFLDKSDIRLLKKLRDSEGSVKYNITFQISLN